MFSLKSTAFAVINDSSVKIGQEDGGREQREARIMTGGESPSCEFSPFLSCLLFDLKLEMQH
jgi:hypothetical protein